MVNTVFVDGEFPIGGAEYGKVLLLGGGEIDHTPTFSLNPLIFDINVLLGHLIIS
jgi:hypothetical protein